ncbi:MAG TPA: hypothetical protein VFX59_04330 [Polyangiales bacterium]|nr:hypothetical protein [Polyangiales bacterium]
MNHAARFLFLTALALGGCGDDNSRSLFSSEVGDRDTPVEDLGDDDKRQFCAKVDSYTNVSVGLDEVARIACAPIALLTSTSRAACEELLDSCARDALKVSLARQQRREECYGSLASCQADVGTLEGCVDINVRALRATLERISCARFGDSTVQDDIDDARTAAGCTQISSSCGDAVLLY